MEHGHEFVVMWCNEGLEYVGDITADNQRVTWEALQGRDSLRHALANPFHLRLRAQFNPQRHYEIYFFNAEDGITEQDIKNMFRYDPQGSADLIRSRGECFYSNRLDTSQRSVIV
jgi:hypothetical protein